MKTKQVLKIRNSYLEKEADKFDELKELNKKVYRPALIFAYIFGTISTLIMGGGMCLVMPNVITGYMALGIALGLVGIVLMVVNYLIYKRIIKKRKREYAERIIALSNEILNK